MLPTLTKTCVDTTDRQVRIFCRKCLNVATENAVNGDRDEAITPSECQFLTSLIFFQSVPPFLTWLWIPEWAPFDTPTLHFTSVTQPYFINNNNIIFQIKSHLRTQHFTFLCPCLLHNCWHFERYCKCETAEKPWTIQVYWAQTNRLKAILSPCWTLFFLPKSHDDFLLPALDKWLYVNNIIKLQKVSQKIFTYIYVHLWS